MHLLFACVIAIKTKISQANQAEAAGRHKNSLVFQVGGGMLVIRLIFSALYTSPPNSPKRKGQKQ